MFSIWTRKLIQKCIVIFNNRVRYYSRFKTKGSKFVFTQMKIEFS